MSEGPARSCTLEGAGSNARPSEPGEALTDACVLSEQCSATARTPGRRAAPTDTSAPCTRSAGTLPPASAAAVLTATRGTAGSALQKVLCLPLILFKGEEREQWRLCFGACFEILPLPRSLKVGGGFRWAVMCHLSLLVLALFLYGGGGRSWGMPFLLMRGGLFPSCGVSPSLK